ncbi:MAG TPA: serine acetyltransferase, partial [Chitinophaga sp.]
MNDFLDELHRRHQSAADQAFPATPAVKDFTQNLVNWLFPEHTGRVFTAYDVLAEYATLLQQQLQYLLQPMASLPQPAALLAQTFMDTVPQIYADLNKDAEAVLLGDPAATCLYEVIRTYPGFYAIAFYRIAHRLFQLKVPLLPRIITELAHAATGIDIHPAAV